MAVPERLGAFALIRFDEERIRIRQGHHEETDLPQDPAHLHQGVSEVHLGLARRMLQGQVHLLAGALELPDRILDDGVTAGEPLFLQTLPDPFGRVTLLPVNVLVRLQDLGNPVEIRIDLGLLWRLASLIAGRARIFENLLECLPVHPCLTQDLTFTDPVSQHASANRYPFSHVHVHFLPFLPKTRWLSQHPQP